VIRRSICIVQPTVNKVSETFISAHAERLPARVTVVHTSGGLPYVGSSPGLSQALVARAVRRGLRLLRGQASDWEVTGAYLSVFRRCRAEAILAEYGPQGVLVLEACRIARLPLVVHFHGYDASDRQVLERVAAGYSALFEHAAALVAVSGAMRRRLLEMGAAPERTHLNVYGVDCEEFGAARPEENEARFLAVGRFVEKKAPHLTLLAFAEVRRCRRDARLCMIGDGPLLGPCQALAAALGLQGAVEFRGALAHDAVRAEMKQARAFVQHSIEACNGDSEGTPVAILEAGASGLPVVSTFHGGIPEIVTDGVTGFLVNEKDIAGMSERMLRLACEPALAARLGRAARQRISCNFAIEQSIGNLWSIIESCIVKWTPQRRRPSDAWKTTSDLPVGARGVGA
jgi:glycosyltransferase involved in cell wall biosynthesis